MYRFTCGTVFVSICEIRENPIADFNGMLKYIITGE